MSTSPGAIVLAAGFSNRYGSLKLCAALDNGKTVYEQTLANIHAAVPDILVVTRPELTARLPKTAARLVSFDHAERGMGATLAFAIKQIDTWQGALICLADMPFITPESYRLIAAASTEDRIVIPRAQGQQGNPVAFGRRFFPELIRLTGDNGGRAVAKAHPEALQHLELDDAAILADIDKPEDLRQLQDVHG